MDIQRRSYCKTRHPTCRRPNTVKVLRVGEPCGAPELTFVFSAMVAGLKCTCLWDSGAATSFIAQQFVQRHGLKVGSHTRQIVLADGSQTSTLGCFDAKLQMEKHSNNMRFHVTKLVDGFDIILGNDWSLQQQVEAKFGGASPTDSHLYLRKTQTRVYPLNNSRRLLPRAHEVEQALLPEVLSAVQVKRILKQGPKRGCLEPFLVVVRQKASSADEGTSPQTLRSDRLKALLDKYSTVFKEPRFGASANTVPPCIELEPGSTPPNRPAFRLPMSQRQEVEKRVAELVESGASNLPVQHMELRYSSCPSPMAHYECASIIERSTRSHSESSTRCPA
jgi:hypothetical protein